MFDILSVIFKYVFVIIIYLFIFTIIRMIYLDIKTIGSTTGDLKAYLKVLNPLDSIPYKMEDTYVLEDELTVGRSSDNSIVIRDPYVSKHHLKISLDESNYFIEDLKSSNGTMLNGNKLEDVSLLKTGDIIKAGDIELMFIHKG